MLPPFFTVPGNARSRIEIPQSLVKMYPPDPTNFRTFSTIADGPFIGSVNRVNIAGGLTLNVIYDNAVGDLQLKVANSPSSDHWTDGVGLWSASNLWSAGVPTANSDVVIGDTVNGNER